MVATLATGVPPESGAGRCGGGALRLFLWRRAGTDEWEEEELCCLIANQGLRSSTEGDEVFTFQAPEG